MNKKVGLIGYGLAGKGFHAPHINACEGLELSSIVSSRQQEINKSYPEVKVVKDIEELFSQGVDIIVIASPNDTHFEYAKRALNNNCHVIIDKPFTPSLKESKELISLAQSKKLFITSFHNRRLDGDFLTIKKLIKENRLGKIKIYESYFNRFRPAVNTANWRETTDTAGGVFYDLAPHLLDQALDLFGLPASVFLDRDQMRQGAKNDDYFKALLFYPDKKIELNAHCFFSPRQLRFRVLGEKAGFEKYGMDPQEGRLKAKGYNPDNGADLEENFGTLYSDDKEELIKTESGNYLKFYENFLNTLLGKEELIVKTNDIINVQNILERLLESAQTNRVINLESK